MTDFQKTEQGQEPAFSNTEPKPLEASVAPAPRAEAAQASSVAASQAPGWERATLEKLAFDSLNEQKSRRRWKTGLSLAWLAFFFFLAWSAMSRSGGHKEILKPHTAVIEIKGEIAAGAEAGADLVMGSVKAAFEDPGAQAVVLLINSPGGSPVQAGIINDEIRRLKALHKGKKVYAVVEETCASGAYYIAVAADEIYADKASIVGSIGVLMDSFGATGLMEKLGVERRLLTAGANKGIGDPFSPLPDKQRAFIQTMLDQIHRQFITVVKQGRGTRLKETPEMFSGLFWNGEQALSLGLIDHIGSLDYVAREVIKAEEVIDYTPKENVAERLAKKFGASIGMGAAKALPSAFTIR